MVVNFKLIIMSIFSKIPVRKPKLVPHDLSATIDFSTQFGRLTPLKSEKVVPGDIIPIGVLHQEQFAPLASKLYQDYRIKTESFFVPSRILWSNFGKFFVAEDNSYVHPHFSPADVYQSFTALLCVRYPSLRIYDGDSSTIVLDKTNLMYRIFWQLFGPSSCFHFLFGSCIGFDETLGFQAFVSQNNDFILYDDKIGNYSLNYSKFGESYPSLWKLFDVLRWSAYYRVLCEYYIDENLQKDLMDYVIDNEIVSAEHIATIIYRYVVQFLSVNPLDIYRSVKDDIVANFNLFHGFFHRCWPKDYFAGALPFKQQGNAVEIPLSGKGVLELQLSDASVALLEDNTLVNNLNVVVAADQTGVQEGYNRVYLQYQNSADATSPGDATVTEPLQTGVTVGGLHTTIEDFRTAYQLQEWLEKNARGGTRYKEQIFSHFGIRTKDSRLDRPEFIVGSTDSVNYGNVFTTFQNGDGDGVPAESVTAISAGGRSRTGVYRVTEHGYIFTLHSIYPTASYALGLFRQGFELDKFDYFWPEFQHLGEQEVYKSELNAANGDDLFGYQPRYSQYKTRTRQIHGDFVDSLPTFTSFRYVDTASLNPSFITIIPQFSNLDRVFNYLATDYDKIYCSVRINSPCLRPIDYYGVPRLFI